MANYKLNPAGFRANLLQSDFMAAEMAARAERVKAVAEASAPIETGHYKESFEVKTSKRGGIHNDRAEGRVITTDPAALSIEFGHLTQGGTFVDGHYTLTRALDAAGD